MTENNIKNICKSYNIKGYTINDDMSIDVDRSVFLNNKELNKLPLNFNKVDDDFYCEINHLTSLKGSPKYVGGNFSCYRNNLTSLLYAPKEINRGITCAFNNIEVIGNIPKCKGLNLYNNNVKTFQDLKNFRELFSVDDNPIEELWYLFQDKEYMEYFDELDIIQENGEVIILDRLNYFLTDIGKDEISKDYIKNYRVK